MRRRLWNEDRIADFLVGPGYWGILLLSLLMVIALTASYLSFDISVEPRTTELAVGDSRPTTGSTTETRQTQQTQQTQQIDNSGADDRIADNAPGEAVFASNCAACHGSSGQGGVGPALVDQTFTSDEISAILTTGPGIMPSFESTLSSDEITAVVEYVVKLGTGATPDPTTTLPETSPEPEDTFGLFCAACHGPGGRGTELGRDLRGREDKVFDAVRFGEKEMPAFSEDALSNAQLGEIIAYVRSIKERD